MANPNHLGEPDKNLDRDTVMEEAMETRMEELGWTEEHLQKLLSGILENIPDTDVKRIYTMGLRRMPWERVAFHPYTAEMCEKKWMEISGKMQKMRTLAELVIEAKCAIENPFMDGNHKIYPNFPQKPCAPSSIFYQEKRAELKKEHPEMKSTKLLSLASTLYKMLPEDEKARYTEKVQKARELYAKGIELLRKQHPEWKARCISRKFHLNASSSTMVNGQVMLPEPKTPPRKQHPEWKAGCISRKFHLNASSSTMVNGQVMLPEPKTPPGSGHKLFCAEQMRELKAVLGHLSSRNRLCVISGRWRMLPENEKSVYHQRAADQKREYLRELQNWSNNLSETERAEFWKQNPKKRCLLEESTGRSGKKKRTSDSEDDDIEIDTSSSEDDGPHNCWGRNQQEKKVCKEDGLVMVMTMGSSDLEG